MEESDTSFIFSTADDGSLLILSRRISDKHDGDSDLTITGHSSIPQEIVDLADEKEPVTTDLQVNAEMLVVKKKPSTADISQLKQESAEIDNEIMDPSDDDATNKSPNEDIADVSLAEIQQILLKEQDNLRMIREANEILASMIMSSSSSSCLLMSSKPETKDAATNTINLDASLVETEFATVEENLVNTGLSIPSSENTNASQKMFSSNLRRRRQPARPNCVNNTPFNVQTFISEYYNSLNSVSRYIISASILSFMTAFLLLSWYSAQVHSHDMEFFKLKEKRAVTSQEELNKYQLQHENFRESIIHQRYEESRACQASLQSCSVKQNELLAQISKQSKDCVNEKDLGRLQAKVETQRILIQDLREKLHELKDNNMELRKEVGQNFNSYVAKCILSFLNLCMNRNAQLLFGTLFTMIVLSIIIIRVFERLINSK